MEKKMKSKKCCEFIENHEILVRNPDGADLGNIYFDGEKVLLHVDNYGDDFTIQVLTEILEKMKQLEKSL